MNEMYVTGDTHGPKKFSFHSVDGVLPRLNTQNFPEQKTMDKTDLVFILGDFGCVWEQEESKEEKNVLDWLENKPFTTCFIDGNHENHARLSSFPVEPWNGGNVHKIRPSVLHLMRGQVFNIGEVKIFTFGGARSHDIKDGILDPFRDADKIRRWQKVGTKFFRINGVSWWPEEMPSQAEMDEGIQNLERNGWTVDFIMTHDCAASTKAVVSMGGFTPDELNRYLENIKQNATWKKWFFGHMHDNRNLPDGQCMLYEQIIRIH